MNADTAYTLKLIGLFVLASAFSAIGGTYFIGYVMRRLWVAFAELPSEEHRSLAGAIGIVERVMYIAAFLLGRPEFIAVWLVLKGAGEWRRQNTNIKSSPPSSELWVPRHVFVRASTEITSSPRQVRSKYLERMAFPWHKAERAERSETNSPKYRRTTHAEEDMWIGTSAEYTVFLIGNALSVMIGVAFALLLQYVLAHLAPKP